MSPRNLARSSRVVAPAAAITAFGLGLIARDGLLILIAWIASVLALGLLGFWLIA